jgi:CheY-specific phosphatase CheX
MREEIRHAAIAVTLEVFGTMFFLPLDPCDPMSKENLAPLNDAPAFLKGEIEFQGKWSGKVKVYLPLELGRIMTENLMGSEEDEISESKTLDMVSELCNVLCGNLLSHMDKKAPHTLRIPQSQLLSLEEIEEDISHGGIAIDFDAEGRWFRLVIQLDQKEMKRDGGEK